MSLVFGGTTVNNVIFNGTTVDRIVFNGVEVYTSGALPDGYLYLNGRTKQGWNAKVHDNYGGLVLESSSGQEFGYMIVNGSAYIYTNYYMHFYFYAFHEGQIAHTFAKPDQDTKKISTRVNLGGYITRKVTAIADSRMGYVTITDVTYGYY